MSDDLISRQQAIDELIKMLSYCFYADEEVIEAVVTTINELPPAQLSTNLAEVGTDCISRQAAIDQTYIFSKDEFLRVTNPFYYLRKRIKSLPSVKPQYTDAEIQKMQELEQAEIEKAYELGKAERQKAGSWIPVSERLPKVGREVLVCFDFKGARSVYISHFYGDGEFHGLDDEYLTSEGRKYRKAVAWMPLPEPYPYKAESEE